MNHLSEREILKDCIQLLEAIGAIVIRNNTGRRGGVSYGKKGSSDIIACLPPTGKFLAVEVKRSAGGVVSQDQFDFVNDVKSRGGLGLIVNSASMLFDELSKEGYLG